MSHGCLRVMEVEAFFPAVLLFFLRLLNSFTNAHIDSTHTQSFTSLPVFKAAAITEAAVAAIVATAAAAKTLEQRGTRYIIAPWRLLLYHLKHPYETAPGVPSAERTLRFFPPTGTCTDSRMSAESDDAVVLTVNYKQSQANLVETTDTALLEMM